MFFYLLLLLLLLLIIIIITTTIITRHQLGFDRQVSASSNSRVKGLLRLRRPFGL
jgi:hypothetical protein